MIGNKEIKVSVWAKTVNKRPGIVFKFTHGDRTIPLFIDQWKDVDNAAVDQWERWLNFGNKMFNETHREAANSNRK